MGNHEVNESGGLAGIDRQDQANRKQRFPGGKDDFGHSVKAGFSKKPVFLRSP